MLEIIYQDQHFIAINKPGGMLVHKSELAPEETVFVLQTLRDQINQHIYPVHRLDRPTSGVLLFAFSSEVARMLSEQLVSKDIKKKYLALVRGWLEESITIDNPVKNDRGNLKDAITHFTPIKHYSLDIQMGKYDKQRYSLIACEPESGRWHQIRQHLAHIRHYIINDRVHGNNKHNKLFKERLLIEPMFLHAERLEICHPISKIPMVIKAELPKHYKIFEELRNVSII